MYPRYLKPVTQTIVPSFVKWHNNTIVDTYGAIKVNLREVFSAPHIYTMQWVQDLYINNMEIMLKHNILHAFTGVITLPIEQVHTGLHYDPIYELWYSEYSMTSSEYIITARSIDGHEIQEYGSYNGQTGDAKVKFRNDYTA
jgi:hypothetical protein